MLVAALLAPVLGVLPVRGVGVVSALALAVGVRVALRRRIRQRDQESMVWRWFARAASVLAVGMLVELVVAVVAFVVTGSGRADGSGPPSGVAVAVSAVAASPFVYQGLVHWNRYKTRVSDPGDWLNGLAAVVALVAIGMASIALSPSPMTQWPVWQLAPWLGQGAVLFVLAGTAFTIISLGGLGRDVRAWAVASTLAAAFVGQVLAATLARGSAAEVAVTTGRATAVSWSVALLGILVAASLPARREALRQATSQSTTTGAVLVLVAAVAQTTFNAVVADPALRWSSAVAAVSAGLAMVRLFRVVSELAQLALSRWEARTDELTGVPNRRQLMETLEGLGSTQAAMVLVDLERFKEVNDRFGHEGGDEVIRVVANRVQLASAGHGTMARLGGDEFAIVLPHTGLAAAADLGRDVAARLAEPIIVGGDELRMGASIGVAAGADVGAGHDELMRQADAAMYLAKRAGGGGRLYDEAADAHDRAERALVADLRVLLGDHGGDAREARHGVRDVGELVVHYQPMLDASTRTVVGVEALVRWAHPQRGLLGPFAFLDLAERHGLMSSITAFVLDRAVGEVATWEGAGADVRLSVNLSGSCLESTHLVDAVTATLARHGFPARRLVLEITETTVVLDDDGAVEVAGRLADLGVALSIDDYGTGYSSLARVLAFPAEELKLDRSFTLRVTADGRTAALVAGTIAFAHRLGLRVVAEGVEDEATLDTVVTLGCDVTQGYLHSRPVPARAIRDWLARRPASS